MSRFVARFANCFTDHAVDRFSERSRLGNGCYSARTEMLICLAAAKPKHIRRAYDRKKRTIIIPTGCCCFVFGKGGNVVTILERKNKGLPSTKRADETMIATRSPETQTRA